MPRDTANARDDRALVAACREGDARAWEALVRKYQHLVYGVALRSGLEDHDAADVFQAVFLSLLQHIETLERSESVASWLLTTTRRQCWRVWREKGRGSKNSALLVEALEEADSVQETLLGLERRTVVHSALAGLDARCRTLLEMLFFSDDSPSYAEVSRRMKMPVASIGPTRLRCLEKLRRAIVSSRLFR